MVGREARDAPQWKENAAAERCFAVFAGRTVYMGVAHLFRIGSRICRTTVRGGFGGGGALFPGAPTVYRFLCQNLFEKTGKLWEKYNAESGELDFNSEYGTPEMLGWTAGVYVVCKNYIEKHSHN